MEAGCKVSEEGNKSKGPPTGTQFGFAGPAGGETGCSCIQSAIRVLTALGMDGPIHVLSLIQSLGHHLLLTKPRCFFICEKG